MMTKVAPVYPEFIDLYEFISNFEDIKSQSELLQIFSKLIIGSNSIGVFENKTKGLGINFPYEESEIIYYKSQCQQLITAVKLRQRFSFSILISYAFIMQEWNCNMQRTVRSRFSTRTRERKKRNKRTGEAYVRHRNRKTQGEKTSCPVKISE